MRRKDDTLRDTLLRDARLIADTRGIDAINIRLLAQRAGVATGTVYNYFSGKDEILLALTEEYWTQALGELDGAITADSFCGQLEEIFRYLREQIDRSAGKLMDSLSHVETAGQQRMACAQSRLEQILLMRINQDPQICQDIWDDTFTKERLARFIMHNLVTALRTKAPDIRFFIALLRRTIYELGV